MGVTVPTFVLLDVTPVTQWPVFPSKHKIGRSVSVSKTTSLPNILEYKIHWYLINLIELIYLIEQQKYYSFDKMKYSDTEKNYNDFYIFILHFILRIRIYKLLYRASAPYGSIAAEVINQKTQVFPLACICLSPGNRQYYV